MWIQSLREFKAAFELVRFQKLQAPAVQLYIIWTPSQFIVFYKIFRRYFTTHHCYVKRRLSVRKYGHSVFARRKIIDTVFIIFFGIRYPVHYLLKSTESPKALVAAISVTCCNRLYNCGGNPENVAIKHLFELLWKISIILF